MIHSHWNGWLDSVRPAFRAHVAQIRDNPPAWPAGAAVAPFKAPRDLHPWFCRARTYVVAPDNTMIAPRETILSD